jgi:hypothetical protein
VTLRGRIAVVLLGITIVVVAGFWLKHHLAIDRCLDQGGSWNYARSACDAG